MPIKRLIDNQNKPLNILLTIFKLLKLCSTFWYTFFVSNLQNY